MIFAFLDEDEHRMIPPPWAISVTLYEDSFEDETDSEGSGETGGREKGVRE